MSKEEDKKALQDYKEGIPVGCLDELIKKVQNQYVTLEDATWGLIRSEDALSKYSREIGFVEWDEYGNFKEIHKGPEGLKVGRSIILSPFTESFTWMTSVITELLPKYNGDIRFKTKNSTYTLVNFENEE